MHTTYNLLTNFNTIYGALVADYISNPERVINRDGKEWAIKDGMCISRAATYRIPPVIAELIGVGNIIKLHALNLCIDIEHDVGFDTGIFNFLYMKIHSKCGCGSDSYSDAGYVWVNDLESKCSSCYNNTNDMHKKLYNLIDITEYNIADWVPFMYEKPSAVYYVNCNTQSSNYGNVLLKGRMHSKILGDVNLFVNHIHSWICYTPSKYSGHVSETQLEVDASYYVDRCDRFLNSPVWNSFLLLDKDLYELHGIPKNPTYMYAILHINDSWEYSEELVERYVNILIGKKGTDDHMLPNKQHALRDLDKMSNGKIRQHARKIVKRNSGITIFKKKIIDGIDNHIYAMWLYSSHDFHSLCAYLTCVL
jgi:hypothetical protein